MTLDAARIRAAALEGIPPKVAPTRLPPSTNPLFGRDDELARLDTAWESSSADKTNLVTLMAWGGVGKTSLVFEWMNRLGHDGWRGARAVFGGWLRRTRPCSARRTRPRSAWCW